MNWLVTWIVISMSIGQCEPIVSTWTDDYGRETTNYSLNLLACYEKTEKPMERYFHIYEEAKYFYDNGVSQNQEGYFQMEDHLCCFKIKENEMQ